MKKFLICIVAVISIAALGITGWVYYPKYQIYKLKQDAVASKSNAEQRQSYVDYLAELQKTEIHHLALGDSIIRGVGSQENQGFVERFSSELEADIGKKIILQNEGVAGITSAKLATMLQTGNFDTAIQSADMITINIGGNDILRTARNTDSIKALQSFDEVQASFVANLTSITTRIHELNPNAIVILLELYNPLEPDHDLYALADQLLPKWNIKLYEAAAKFETAVVIETPKVINGDNLQYLSDDGVHPNDEGYAAISKQVLGQLEEKVLEKAL